MAIEGLPLAKRLWDTVLASSVRDAVAGVVGGCIVGLCWAFVAGDAGRGWGLLAAIVALAAIAKWASVVERDETLRREAWNAHTNAVFDCVLAEVISAHWNRGAMVVDLYLTRPHPESVRIRRISGPITLRLEIENRQFTLTEMGNREEVFVPGCLCPARVRFSLPGVVPEPPAGKQVSFGHIYIDGASVHGLPRSLCARACVELIA